jgi:hypothetical protein
MQGHRGEECTIDTRKALSGCGKRNGKGVNGPKKGEGTNQGKLRGMGLMCKWMEVGAHLSKRVKLTPSSPSNACWDSSDAE